MCSGNTLDLINGVTLRQARLVPGWVTVFGWVNHLGAKPGTQAYSAWARPLWVGWHEYLAKAGSKQAHRVIHYLVSVVLQCGAGAWLKDSGSTLETYYTLMHYRQIYV